MVKHLVSYDGVISVQPHVDEPYFVQSITLSEYIPVHCVYIGLIQYPTCNPFFSNSIILLFEGTLIHLSLAFTPNSADRAMSKYSYQTLLALSLGRKL